MAIETSCFEKYIEALREIIIVLVEVTHDPYKDLDNANKVWKEFDAIHLAAGKQFLPTLKELRKNLIGIESETMILNYKNYIKKEMDDLIDIANSNVLNLVKPKDYDQYWGSSMYDNLTFPTWEIAIYEINEYLGFWVRDEDLTNQKEQLIHECEYELKLRKNDTEGIQRPHFKKLKWNGTPAQLVFIINLLQTKGYIEGLSSSGERNGQMLLSMFEIEGFEPSAESLGRYFQQLKRNISPINPEDTSKFLRFPPRSELKR